LLFQVVFQARIASESHQFDFAQVCDAIADKLTRRHPHVFGDVSVSGSREVVKNWERIKADERTAKGEAPRSAIGGVPVGLPALVRAERVTEKAAAVGFDWPDLAGVLAKVREELGELEAAIVQHPPGAAAPDEAGGGGVPPPPGGTRRAEQMTEEPALPATGGARRAQQTIAHELGDLLFALANLGRFVNVHPEEALRGAIRRFESRFHHVEARLREQGRTPREATLAEMDGHWDEAKRLEKARKTPS
jgi:ATP diphosphatase